MNNASRIKTPSFAEFVILVALIISLVALSIDTMLPALPMIGSDLELKNINDSQYVITVFFAGLGLGQLLFGPWSDVIGRKIPVMVGFLAFIAGCVLAIESDSFETMLLGRFLQGFGAAAPRIVTIALVRDLYKGREMARVMSFVMSVFILVPVFAPAIGQLVIALSDWRAIFILFLLLTLVLGPWFWFRLPETLLPQHRIRLRLRQLGADIGFILTHRAVLGYTLTMGFVFGAFVGYLSSAQQIFQQLYGLGELFPVYFGALAASIGVSTLVNAHLVLRLGMRRLCKLSLWMATLLTLPFLALTLHHAGHPPLIYLMVYLRITFFFVGILFGNLNALAMEPLGHIAGLGSAVVGSLSTIISVLLGIVVAGNYNQTIIPLIAGFALLYLTALVGMYWVDRKK